MAARVADSAANLSSDETAVPELVLVVAELAKLPPSAAAAAISAPATDASATYLRCRDLTVPSPGDRRLAFLAALRTASIKA
jgi:hypothetical protein